MMMGQIGKVVLLCCGLLGCSGPAPPVNPDGGFPPDGGLPRICDPSLCSEEQFGELMLGEASQIRKQGWSALCPLKTAMR